MTLEIDEREWRLIVQALRLGAGTNTGSTWDSESIADYILSEMSRVNPLEDLTSVNKESH